MHCATNCPGSENRTFATPNHHSKLMCDPPVRLSTPLFMSEVWESMIFSSDRDTGRVCMGLFLARPVDSHHVHSRSSSAHLGNPSRERRSHFTVYFSAGFSDKTVPCTMNELYLTGATREDACAHCTMRKYSRKRVTQNVRPSQV